MRRQINVLTLGVLVLAWPGGQADAVASAVSSHPSSEPTGPRVVKLTIHPAPLPKPAMKYLLMPDYLEQTPGNAEPMIYLASQLMKNAENSEGMAAIYDQVNKWLDLPAEKLPRADVAKALERAKEALHYAKVASRREWCEWDVPGRSEGISVPLPSLASARLLGKLLALRARMAISEGRYDDAIDDLKTGFGFGRYAGAGSTLIHNLVGAAIGSLVAKELEQWVERPGSPNLYWALADLPRPFIDSRRSCQFERGWLYFECPLLQSLDSTALTPQQASALLDQIIKIEMLDEASNQTSDSVRADKKRKALVDAIAKKHTKAREQLIAQGYRRELVEAMPPEQAVLLDPFDRYRELRDEVFKLFALPFWQAREALTSVEKQIGKESARIKAEFGGSGLFIALLPSLSRAHFLLTRVNRDIAGLQCIEAIRAYAANHNGKLPPSLADIKEVPVPADPVTGQPFQYEFAGDRATLVGLIKADPSSGDGVRYELQIAK